MTELGKSLNMEDKIKISEEVIATIAGIAASEVESLASMSGGLVDGIVGILGRKNPGRGIKVEIKDGLVSIEISVIIQYGSKIHEVSKDIQSRVREAVESMTGMQVLAVNINVLGVSVGKEGAALQVVDDTQA